MVTSKVLHAGKQVRKVRSSPKRMQAQEEYTVKNLPLHESRLLAALGNGALLEF
jgi:hypothetical protein